MIKSLKLVFQYWPVVASTVYLIEAMMDDDTPGDVKKMRVLDAIVKLLEKSNIKPTEGVINTVSKMIDVFVTVFNSLEWGAKLEGFFFADSEDKAVKEILKAQPSWESGKTPTG
jgi:hypothetical protein